VLQSPGQLERDIDEMMKEDTGYDADMSTMTMYITPRDRKLTKVIYYTHLYRPFNKGLYQVLLLTQNGNGYLLISKTVAYDIHVQILRKSTT
jgi:hypothetical protein